MSWVGLVRHMAMVQSFPPVNEMAALFPVDIMFVKCE